MFGSGGLQLAVMAAGFKPERKESLCSFLLILVYWDYFSTSEKKNSHESNHIFQNGERYTPRCFLPWKHLESLEFNADSYDSSGSEDALYSTKWSLKETRFPAVLHIESKSIWEQPCFTCRQCTWRERNRVNRIKACVIISFLCCRQIPWNKKQCFTILYDFPTLSVTLGQLACSLLLKI